MRAEAWRGANGGNHASKAPSHAQPPIHISLCHDGGRPDAPWLPPAPSTEPLPQRTPYDKTTQIHLWIFLIAIFHVVCAVIMLLLAEWRLRQWRGWQTGDLLRSAALRRQQSLASFRREVAGLGVAHAVADTRVADQPPAEGEAGLGGVPTARPSSSSASQAGSENVLELQLGNGTPRDKGLRTAADVEGQPVGPPLSSFRHADTAPGTAPGTAPPGTAPSASPSSTSPGAPPPGEPRLRRQSLGETLQQLMQSKKRQWRRRSVAGGF